MNPGKLNKEIEFLTKKLGEDGKPARDEYGELTGEYDIFKTVFASKTPIIGKAFFTALSADTKVEVKFNCRYFEGVANDMRIKHGNEIYEIISAIDVDSAHVEILCYCSLVRL